MGALLICATTFAQQKSASFIAINGGISLPTGNWAKSTEVSSTDGFVSDPSGYAAAGPIVSLSGAYFFSKHIGVGGFISFAGYKTKVEELSAGYQESFDVDQVTTTATSYKLWNFMPGLYFNFQLQHTLSFTARALAGITSGSTPLITVDVEDGGIDDGTFEQKSASKSAFGFDLGAGLSYSLNKHLAVNLNADYFYSKPDFTIQNTMRQNSAGREITEYDQPLAGVNIGLGLAYLFGK